ncbi:saccharopine dehydrogenase [Desulfosarcina ovata subsp. sediminis]|uniref:Saccharopine dehydrogenase n=1 Tax=Desulfosarcina ovata subsp. sediminis TaxID=885957 RepID=A0A5K7ZUA5_9BACT|nr:saccharopine dehydrogenase NADP-binding domain-containing protein [Desulfosarcina ovata]BBO83802.1 saccharopine dehydrogenase [Desulfosarcina ovata subsp. sediminis]
MQIGVVGAAGGMALTVLHDLAESTDVGKVVLVDLEVAKEKMECRAQDFGQGKFVIASCDVDNHEALRSAIKGCDAVANCTGHHRNLKVMEACLAERCHYTDMGGLFHFARKQMQLNSAFKERGLTAVLGMGTAPGMVNVMGRYAVDMLEEVHAFHIRDGIVNLSSANTPLAVPYSMDTILDEFIQPPYVFTDGDWVALQPFSLPESIDFPQPVGTQTVFATIHSEVATVPVSFRDKGLQEMSFKLALPKIFEDKLRFLTALGFGDDDLLKVGEQKVSPRQVLIEMVNALPKATGKPADHKALFVDVSGRKDNRDYFIRTEMMCHPYEPWNVGAGPFSVGFPVALTLRMLAGGLITQRGALPPEVCIPPKPFFKGLAERGLTVKVHVEYPALGS